MKYFKNKKSFDKNKRKFTSIVLYKPSFTNQKIKWNLKGPNYNRKKMSFKFLPTQIESGRPA